MTSTVKYRFLSEKDISRNLFACFVRKQIVTDCWRKIDGNWIIRNNPFVDDWSEKDYSKLVNDLRDTVRQNGMVIGAFMREDLKGFAAVTATLFGKNKEYLDLPCIHVSQDARGQGIGRTLFEKAKEWAKTHGAKKLYISAHSSVETQAFYRVMGCVEAEEYNAEHVLQEPFDCQLELKL